MLEIFQKPRRAAVPSGASPFDATRMFDDILRHAAHEGASDVHLEPKEEGLVVRFRLDGEMREHQRLPVAQREPLLARGKILGGMDITEKRLPQDGRAVLRDKGHRFNLRLSTLPTVHGESLVIRLLDQTMPGQNFEELGLAPAQAECLRTALAGPAGIILLTGPTGSGKTTTLHSALHALDHQARVIHTLEDPVEYEFPGIRQTDIRAALTGHLVLSTLHTNDALAAIPRLRDLGVEGFLLAASLRLVAAQRLVRRLCAECKEPHPDNARLRELHGMPDARFCRPVGCPACRARGYRGRIAIHEVLPAGKFLPLIAANAPHAELTALRDREGYLTLWQHGLAVAASGLTTLEQVARVL
jgi:type II secretory ATPase GspE/PulE/Tfp pilus assembly ATPase PilB-like protein